MRTNLKYIRKMYGLTMRELAGQIGVTANAINLWENQDTNITDKNLNNLANVLKLDKQLLIQENLNDDDLKEISKSKYTYDIDCKFNIKEIEKYESFSKTQKSYFDKILYCLENKENDVLSKHIISMLDDINV